LKNHKKVCKAAPVPGETKIWQYIALTKRLYLLDCPDEGAKKIWISQGLTADLGVVIANLFVKGKSHGPHAFLMELRRNGELVAGVSMEDMGDKTIGNDLDNARISFSNVWIPKSALMDKYSGIENGEFVQRRAGTSNMDMIGQRLYTGRAVIAASTLVFARTLYKTSQQYADGKKCWHPKGSIPLSDIPQLSTLYKEADRQLSAAFGSLQVTRDGRSVMTYLAGRLKEAQLCDEATCASAQSSCGSFEEEPRNG